MDTPSLKGRLPFRLATTSFIFPAGWAANCRRLGTWVDEIELLFFASRSLGDLPSPAEIRELAAIAQAHDLTYNIHLPIDIHPGSSERAARSSAADTVKRTVDLTQELAPTTRTLHFPREPGLAKNTWRDNIRDTVSRILAAGYPPRTFSIETLDYPLHWVSEIISDFDLSICIDIGHLIRYGQPLPQTLDRWQERTTIIHLHGVRADRDHLSLEHLQPEDLEIIQQYLASFRKTVSLEVFNYPDFQASVRILQTIMMEGNHGL